MNENILEPTDGRKRVIITYKHKTKRKNKDVDKQTLLQQNVDPHLQFVDVANMQVGVGTPMDEEGLTAMDINDYKMPTLFAALTQKEITSLKKDPNVDHVEPDGIFYILNTKIAQTYPAMEPVGPMGNQSVLTGPLSTEGPTALADTIPWGISAVGAPSCWEATQGKEIYVAVIDTGIAPHNDLAGNLLGGISFVPGETWVDTQGHGTHVSGTIAARMNGIGVVGVAPATYLYGIKVLSNNGSGAWSWLMQGLYWMRYNYGWLFDVANMSMGGSSAPSALEAYINYAAQTTLLVAAAGNNGGSPDHDVIFPARYPACLAVAAIDSANNRAPFSAYGPRVDICAPGVNVTSTIPGNNYATWSGTSMATPHVTGAAVLCRAAHRWTSLNDIKALLTNTAIDLGAGGRDNFFGYGRVNCVGATFSKKK